MLLFVTALLMFGIPLTMMNFYIDLDHPLIDSITGIFSVDLLLNQYLLSLGEFSSDGFEHHVNKILVWIIFISATFFTQITMLNMLIAIMGDTFAKVTENRSMYTTQNRIAIMQDFSGNFRRPTKSNLFLYVVTQQEENEDSEISWEGSINTLRIH